MNHLVLEYLAVPHVITLAVRVKDIHCYVWLTCLSYYRAVCSISHVDCTILFRCVAYEWFSSLKRVHVILKNCHDFVLIEVRYPVEESIEITGRIFVKGLAHRVYWYVVVNKFNFVSILLPFLQHETLLITKLMKKYPSKWCRYPESRTR